MQYISNQFYQLLTYFPWKYSGLFSWIIIELRIWSTWNLFSKEYFVCISDIGYCMVSMIYHFHLYKMHQNPNGIIHNHIFSRQLPSIASENQWMLDNCKNFYQYQVQFAINRIGNFCKSKPSSKVIEHFGILFHLLEYQLSNEKEYLCL